MESPRGDPYTVLGWSQGTFRIARNADTGMEIVTQDSAMASVFDPGTREFRRTECAICRWRCSA